MIIYLQHSINRLYITIDNIRVLSAREVGISIRANIYKDNIPLPYKCVERFATKKSILKTWGEAIELRVGKWKWW